MRGLAPAIFVVSFLTGCASVDSNEPPALETDEQKTLYAVGVAQANKLRGIRFDEAELVYVKAGFGDRLVGEDSRVDLSVYMPKANTLLLTRYSDVIETEKREGQAFCEAMAKEEGAQLTASGAIYFEIEAGEGPSPEADDTVNLHYHGTLRNGSVFDSSVNRGKPTRFNLGRVVPCFSEGVQAMKVGGKAKLVCPAETAYGDRGSLPKIPRGAAIIFEVELLEIVEEEEEEEEEEE
jgi:FKBP-type peptidyl-prolyl cis-trans isomerase FkpA